MVRTDGRTDGRTDTEGYNIIPRHTLVAGYKNASVRNFRMWTLSGEKRYICVSKCGRNVLKTRRYDSAQSTHFFISLILLKPKLNSCRLSQ